MLSWLTLASFVLAGGLAGVLSGLLGIGGGLVLVPVLTLHAIPLHQAVGISLIYILITGTAGVWRHFRQGNLRFSVSVLLALAGSLCSFPGVQLSQHLPSAYLAWLFAGLIAAVMILYLRRSQTVSPRVLSIRRQRLLALVIGAAAGLLSGLFGIGGGILMTPLLQAFLSFSIAESIGTSLGAVVLIAVAGIFSHLWIGDLAASLAQWPLALGAMGLAGVVSAPFGAHLTTVIPARWLKRMLLALMAGLGFYMVFLGFQAR